MTTLIEADALRKTFGAIVAVDDISLTVAKGEVLGFLGPNGAGKSTTMKMLTGFLEPDSGTARIAGHDIIDDPVGAKRQLGYLPEGAPAYSDMTPRTFLNFIAEIRGLTGGVARTKADAAAEKAGLLGVWNQRIETLSKGYKRRVGIAQAILHDPAVLIMDEPTDGLDPNQQHQIRELIKQMAKDKAIIISTHILQEVDAICTRAVIIDKGRVVADGTADQLESRLPYHKAVAIRLAPAEADKAKAALERVAGVKSVDVSPAENGFVRIRAFPSGETVIATAAAAALREAGVDVAELIVEKGRLDDVFRQITSHDGARRNA